jgi:hypothetical protein
VYRKKRHVKEVRRERQTDGAVQLAKRGERESRKRNEEQT